jgi:hypothetical protein
MISNNNAENLTVLLGYLPAVLIHIVLVIKEDCMF